MTVSHIQLPPSTHHWPPKPSIKSNTSPNLYRKAFHPHRIQKSLKVYCEEEIYEHWKTPLNYTLNAFCSDQPGGRGFERRLYTSAGIKKNKTKKLTIKSICCDSDGRTLRWVVKKRKVFVKMCLKYGETF